MTAGSLAQEFGVSRRTVLRDVEALSLAGVPVYAERGRNGGFSLLPGWETDHSGFTHDEALAMLVAGQGRSDQALNLSSALSSAVLKMVDELPAKRVAPESDAAQHTRLEPEDDLITPPPVTDNAATTGRERSPQYLADVDQVTAVVWVSPERPEAAVRAARTSLIVRSGEPDTEGRVRLEVTYQDMQHAERALWQVAEDVEVLEPASLRAFLRDRAITIAARHA